jgi:large subunit ribosomal protein L7e
MNSRSVPTHDNILVPETLLKKRKSQEKARAERLAEVEKKKKVGGFRFYYPGVL